MDTARLRQRGLDVWRAVGLGAASVVPLSGCGDEQLKRVEVPIPEPPQRVVVAPDWLPKGPAIRVLFVGNSLTAAYLAALVIVQQLTGIKPEGLPSRLTLSSGKQLEIPKESAANLQNLAGGVTGKFGIRGDPVRKQGRERPDQ